MSRTVTVPIDLASEQKEILGIISKRQLIYLIVTGSILYMYIPIVFKIFSILGWHVGIIVSLFAALPTAVPLLILGFLKKGKHNMFYDQYLWIMINRKSQYGSWRKGSK